MEKYTKKEYLVFVEKMKKRHPNTTPFSFNVWKGISEILDIQHNLKKRGKSLNITEVVKEQCKEA